MGSGFKLGRVFGINLFVDWSWLFIFLLVTWNLAGAVFPQLHPDWGPALNVGLGVVASLLFFASVLAHELAHSLVAQARGLPVRRITLFLFGGVSNIQREPESPGTEFLMAIVGPLTSIVLGIIFLLLGQVSALGQLGQAMSNPGPVLSRLSPLATLLLWLGPINIILGIFNLIPGFPLDGGRVLRSIFWAATGNLRQATRWASTVGQAIGWLFVITGIAMVFGVTVPFFGTGFAGGLWLAFIGWFLTNAASQSYRQVVVQDLLEGVPVSRLMRSNVPTVPIDTPVADIIHHYVMNTDERAFPVMSGDQLAGLVCLEDLRRVPRSEWDTTPVSQIMTPADKLAMARPDEDAAEVLNLLTSRNVGQIPVVAGSRLVGLVRHRDFVRWLQVHSEFAPG